MVGSRRCSRHDAVVCGDAVTYAQISDLIDVISLVKNRRGMWNKEHSYVWQWLCDDVEGKLRRVLDEEMKKEKNQWIAGKLP